MSIQIRVYSRNALTFGLGARVPLGEDEEIKPAAKARSFSHKPIWQRFIIVAGGPVFNLIFASLLGKKLPYSKIYQMGLHTITVAEGITKLSSLVFKNSVNSLFSFAFLGISFIALLGINRKNE